MDSLRIPKRRATVEVLLTDGSSGRFELFLSDKSPRHAGPERLIDLLSEAERFLPTIEQKKDGMAWLNTRNIVFARAALDAETQPEIESLPTEHEIELVLQAGPRLRGLVSYIRPDGQSRPTDFLNDAAEPFLQLLEAESIVFVNKRHIVRVLAGGS